MDDEVQNLSEVVVTALGIKKDAKKLGYSVSSITREAITENRTPNFMNALQGQIAGVNISPLGTGPAGTSKIRIRGQSSISGQNSPLIVVNGIPIYNTNFGTNPGNAEADNSIGVRGGGNTSDGGDGLSSINPDDIENMTVLKSATAAIVMVIPNNILLIFKRHFLVFGRILQSYPHKEFGFLLPPQLLKLTCFLQH